MNEKEKRRVRICEMNHVEFAISKLLHVRLQLPQHDGPRIRHLARERIRTAG